MKLLCKFIHLFLAIAFLVSCVRDQEPQYIPPSVNTVSAEASGAREVVLSASVSNDNFTECGFFFGTTNPPTGKVSAKKLSVSEGFAFSSYCTAEPATTYYYYAFVSDGYDVIKSEVKSISTPAIAVTGVSLDPTSLVLTEGESTILTATVTPVDATNKKVSWTSSDPSVATVENGKVSAIKPGTVEITVTTEDGGKTATCSVTVNKKFIAVESISLDRTSLELKVGESYSFSATVTPDDATDKTIEWTSSDSAFASIDQNGKVTAIKAGSVTITAQAGDKTATCSLQIIQPVTSVSLDKSTLSLVEGTSATLTATVLPSDASNKNVTWKSSNTSVATVSDGKVTAIKVGTATITVTTADGSKTATCAVTVTAATVPVTGVSLNKTTLSLVEGNSETLTATVTPSNATNKNVNWTSSNSSVATVSNGTVTAVKAGSTTITVTTVDGGKTATCAVTVTAATVPVTGVSLNKTSLSLEEGSSETLTATVTPSNATNKNVNWTSSNTSVATVSNGTVTAVKAGSATITVTTVDGSKTATCVVTVTAATVPVTGVSLNKTSLSLAEWESEYLNAYVSPSNATNKTVTWTSSNTSVATVSNTGLVTALKVGSATITVTTADGNYKASCFVTIVYEPSVLSFTADIDDSSIALINNGGNKPDLLYSKDRSTWVSWDYSTINLNCGESVYLRGDNPYGFSKGVSKNSQFVMTGVISAKGSVMSLLYSNGISNKTIIPNSYCFYNLFNGCTSLVEAPTLPATTLKIGCYSGMFSGCTSLTTAPELPATTLARSCYSLLFNGCTSLIEAPSLPAPKLEIDCYGQMFSGCTSLKSAPVLPATTLADNCYQHMFWGCTSLNTAPVLPATTLAKGCYYCMFRGCSSLVEAPALPANNLTFQCYTAMFEDCTSLTVAPDLPAKELAEECYESMFSVCKSLTVAPALPATTLVKGCYGHMFSSCTSLKTAPVLPATTLADHCYYAMFSRCSQLNYVKMLAITIPVDLSDPLSAWLKGVSATGTFVKNKDATWSVSGDSGIPEGWTVLAE